MKEKGKNNFYIKTKFEKTRPMNSTDIKLWIAYAYHLEGYIEGLLEGIKNGK